MHFVTVSAGEPELLVLVRLEREGQGGHLTPPQLSGWWYGVAGEARYRPFPRPQEKEKGETRDQVDSMATNKSEKVSEHPHAYPKVISVFSTSTTTLHQRN